MLCFKDRIREQGWLCIASSWCKNFFVHMWLLQVIEKIAIYVRKEIHLPKKINKWKSLWGREEDFLLLFAFPLRVIKKNLASFNSSLPPSPRNLGCCCNPQPYEWRPIELSCHDQRVGAASSVASEQSEKVKIEKIKIVSDS